MTTTLLMTTYELYELLMKGVCRFHMLSYSVYGQEVLILPSVPFVLLSIQQNETVMSLDKTATTVNVDS